MDTLPELIQKCKNNFEELYALLTGGSGDLVTGTLEVAGLAVFLGRIAAAGGFTLFPVDLILNTGDNEDVSFSSNVTVARISPGTGGSSIAGIMAPENGQFFYAFNIDAVETVTFEDEGSSTPANSIAAPSSVSFVLAPKTGCSFWYDTQSARWRIVAA